MKVLLIDQIAKVNYKYTYSLANALINQKIDLKLVIDSKMDNQDLNFKPINLFNTADKNIGKLKKGINYIQSYLKLLKLIKIDNIDVLHTQWVIFSPIDYLFLRKCKKKGVKLVVTIHDILPFNEKKYDYYFHKKIYDMADSIIVQAEDNVSRFHELFPNNDNEISNIPHGHFLDYAKGMDKKSARDYLNIENDRFVFLFFGQIKKVKGLDILIKAFSSLAKENQDILLLIAGSVWKDEYSQYEKLIDESYCKDRIHAHIKYIPDEEVDYFYSAADVCVLPYKDVYQSGVIQLCYAYKKPVVASKLPAFTQIVEEDMNGFLAEVNDIDSFSEAMCKAYNTKRDLDEYGECGYKFIKDKYSWEEIALKISKIYLSILNHQN